MQNDLVNLTIKARSSSGSLLVLYVELSMWNNR